ncbi:MAG: adenosine kinase, partial [Flavobacteriaceae bacterium]
MASPTRFDVVGIGNAIVDVIARTDDDFLVSQSLARGSMRLIDEAEADRLYGLMGSGVESSGGSAANTIAGIAGFGGSAAFLGRVRDDGLGKIFAHDIRALGIHYPTSPAVRGPGTARCLILVTPDGERTMNTYLGAAQELTPDDMDEETIAASACTYLEGYLWDPPQAKEAFLRAAGIAHAHGRQVALSLSDSFCVDRYRAEFLNLMRDGVVDIVFANSHEVRSLYETADLETAIGAIARDVAHAV